MTMDDYAKRLDELEREWLYPDNAAAVNELWSIARALLKERDELRDASLCVVCRSPAVGFELCLECFFKAGGMAPG
jgi:hypothetical protein